MIIDPLVVVASALFFVDEAAPDLLVIEQTLLIPEGNLIWGDGQLRLHPKLMAQAVAGGRKDTDQPWASDPSWGGVAGVEARWSPIREQLYTAEILGGAIVNSSTPKYEDWRGLVRLTWQRASPMLNLQAHGVLRLDQQELVYAAQNIRLIQRELGIGCVHQGRSLQVDSAVVVRNERYFDDGAVGEGNRRNWSGLSIPVNLGWQTGSRLRWTLAPGFESYTFESDSDNPNGVVTRLTAGGGVQPLDHWHIDVGLGFAWWTWQTTYADNPAWGGKQLVVPESHLNIRWDFSEHDVLTLSASQGSQPGVSATTVAVERAAVQEEHHFDRRWRITGECSVIRVNDQEGRFDEPEQRHGISGIMAVDYLHQQGWRLRWFGSADASRMLYGISYDRWASGVQSFLIW